MKILNLIYSQAPSASSQPAEKSVASLEKENKELKQCKLVLCYFTLPLETFKDFILPHETINFG